MSGLRKVLCAAALGMVAAQAPLSNQLSVYQAKGLAVSKDSNRLLVGGTGIQVFDISNPTPSSWPTTQSFTDNPGGSTFTAVAYSPDGKWAAGIASGGSSDQVIIWSTSNMAGSGGSYTSAVLAASRSYTQPTAVNYPQGRLSALAFTPDSSMLVTGYRNLLPASEIHLWNVSTFPTAASSNAFGSPMTTPAQVIPLASTAQVTSIAVHPSGSWAAVGQFQGSMTLFRVVGTSWTSNYTGSSADNSGANPGQSSTFVTFSADGSQLAWSYSYVGTAVQGFSQSSGLQGTRNSVSDTSIYGSTGTNTWAPTGQWAIRDVEISPDGKTLAVLLARLGASTPGTCKLYALNGQMLVSPSSQFPISASAMAFARKNILLIANLDSSPNVLQIWQTDAATTTVAATTPRPGVTTTGMMASGTTLACPADNGVAAAQTWATCAAPAATAVANGGTVLPATTATVCQCLSAYLSAVSGCAGMPNQPSPSQYGCTTTTTAAPKSTAASVAFGTYQTSYAAGLSLLVAGSLLM